MTNYKYVIIANSIRDDIVKGSLINKLPTEHELTQAYEVSRITIRKAIEILKEEEIIYSKQGSGFYINTLKKNILTSVYKKQNRGFSKEHNGLNFTTKVISFEIIPCPIKIASFLDISPNEKVYKIKRLRQLNDKPDRLEYTYFPFLVVKHLTSEICEQSIYKFITEILQLEILKTHDFFFVDYPDECDRKYLELTDYESVVILEQIGYLSNNQKFQYSQTLYTNESFSYKNITIF